MPSISAVPVPQAPQRRPMQSGHMEPNTNQQTSGLWAEPEAVKVCQMHSALCVYVRAMTIKRFSLV